MFYCSHRSQSAMWCAARGVTQTCVARDISESGHWPKGLRNIFQPCKCVRHRSGEVSGTPAWLLTRLVKNTMLVTLARLAIIRGYSCATCSCRGERLHQIIIGGIMSLWSSKKRRDNLNEHKAVSFFWIQLTLNVQILCFSSRLLLSRGK